MPWKYVSRETKFDIDRKVSMHKLVLKSNIIMPVVFKYKGALLNSRRNSWDDIC